MPNWVANRVSVRGSASEVERFEDTARQKPNIWTDEIYKTRVESDEDIFSFANFIAPPQEAVDSGEYWGTHGFEKGEWVGHTPNNWYEFNTREWETKWDACEVSRAEVSGGVDYGFDTAWSPPEPVFRKMSEMFPELTFDIWWEEEQGFGAEFVLEAGELTSMRTWDIPSSHQDYLDQDREDDCVCNHEAKEHWYPDCGELTEFEVKVTRTFKVTARSEEQARNITDEVVTEIGLVEQNNENGTLVTELEDGVLIELNELERTE
jgi:hypothetical protein